MIVGSMYRPPTSNCHEIINTLNELVNKLKSEKEQKEIIIGLDHNLDLLKSATHNLTQKFMDTLSDLDLLPTITRPTRIMKISTTLIENIPS